MTWLGQVLHVARKDAREQAWPIRSYIIVTALAALTVFAQQWMGLSNAFAIAVFLFGMILVASVVQSDPPTSSDSFWGSRPFRPAAMLGAKVLLAAIIVLVPAIAQVVALSAFDVDSREAFFAIAESSRTYAVWLLAAMAIAGLTRDVRLFLVSFAAIFAAVGSADSLWEDAHYWPFPNNPNMGQTISLGGPGLWSAIAVCAAVALVLLLYRRWEAPRRMWIAAIAVVVSAMSATFISQPAQANVTSVRAAPKIPVRVELLRSERLGKDDRMNLRVAAAGNAGSRRVLLYVNRVTIYVRDGKPVIVWADGDPRSIVTAGNPLGADIHWLPNEADSFSSFSRPLSSEQRSAIAKGVTGLEVEASVHVLEARTIGTLPLEPKRSSIRHGTRLTILSVTPAPDGGTLSVQSTAALQSQPSHFLSDPRALAGRQYALVNEARGEADYPYTTESHAGQDLLFVLPSMSLLNNTSTLQMRAYGGTVRDATWFMGARLALLEWKEVDTYDVRIPIVQVPTPPELRPRDSTIQRTGNHLGPLDAVPQS